MHSASRITLDHDRYVVDPDNGHVWVAAGPDRSISFADMEFALTLTALTIFHDGGADAQPQRAEQLIASAEAFDCLLGYDPAPRRHSLNVIMASGSSDDDPPDPDLQCDAHRI